MSPINSVPTSGFSPWQPAAWLRVEGADAFTFLQGQFTNDLRALAQGAVYGLWLTLKGKVMGDGFVLAGTRPTEFWVGSYHTSADLLRERLESFIIADDVIVEDQTIGWSAVSVFGPAPVKSLGPTAPGWFVFQGRRGRPANLEWVFRREVEAEVKHALQGVPEWEEAAVEVMRITAGIPAVPADIGPNDLPNEGGLEDEAISFTKGCYLGQEVMARLKSMGQIRRRLLRVRGQGVNLPARGTPLFAGARQVGEIRSAVADGSDAFLGLAMISLINLAGHTALALTADGVPVIQILDTL